MFKNLNFDGVLDKMLRELCGDSVVDGNAKYLVGKKGEQARQLEQVKLAETKIVE